MMAQCKVWVFIDRCKAGAERREAGVGEWTESWTISHSSLYMGLSEKCSAVVSELTGGGTMRFLIHHCTWG